MTTAETIIRRAPSRCWASFIEARTLAAWVPGLERAKVVRQGEDGLPLEVLFEFDDTLSYSLVYSYDAARRRVDWRPGVGKKEALTGFAEFAEHEGGATRMTYGVEPGAERRSGIDPLLLVQAFARWMERGPK